MTKATCETETTAGRVSGRADRGVNVFLGIPYGGPTGGDARFRPPGPALPWRGVRECLEHGPSCPQMTTEQFTGMPVPAEAEPLTGFRAVELVTGEDCLVLNVWTPALDRSAGLPVLVWLHGGGWSIGSASWPMYEFDNLAREHGVVMVGLNHRVGSLGFLDLSSLDPDLAESGLVGMLDVVAALEWVRDNIAGFGGDPGNVTVFGQSGGGAKVTTLLAMPSARGLFHKAVSMSGSTPRAQTADAAEADTRAFLSHLGVGSDLRSLRQVDVRRFAEAERAVRNRSSLLQHGPGFFPVLGTGLPEHPLDAVRGGSTADVVTVFGCTSDEMMAFMAFDPDLWALDDAEVRRRFGRLSADADGLFDAYRTNRPAESATSLYIALFTDALMKVPMIRFTEAAAEAGGRAPYQYLFTWGSPDPEGRVRSVHGLDMPYFFDNVDKAPLADGPHAKQLSRVASGSLVALARRGAPGHEALPEWPPYTTDTRATMQLDVEPALTFDLCGEERRAWEGVEAPGLRS
jgi:para-nitrobenzyl esterase